MSTTFDLLPAHGDDCHVVVSVPHAGLEVPAEDGVVMALDARGLLRDADLYVDRLAASVPSLGIPVVRARVSRYVLDCNRAPDDVDRDVCPEIDKPALPSPRGLCWRLTTENTPVLRRKLRVDEVRSRIARIHKPYHDQIAALLEDRRKRFGKALLVDLHSMPSLGRLGHPDPSSRRADVIPGNLNHKSCAPAVMRAVVQTFEEAGFRVQPNHVYLGGYITQHHGRDPARGIHAIQVELNRDLYMDESTYRYDDERAARLIPHLTRMLERLKALPLPHV